MNRQLTILLSAVLSASTMYGTPKDSTARRDVVGAWVGDSVPALYAVSDNNPALRTLAHPYGLTILGIDYGTMRRDSVINPQQGRGFDRYGVSASTYTRTGINMVLEGHASYHRSTSRKVVWNETADAAMIYPYFAADSVGGDIQTEIYDFGGSYSDRRGKLIWGGALDYTAGLHWRSVDPRPRNVTANLRARAGIAWAFSPKAVIGIAARYTRYKQTSSIKFESEMGQDKIYHLTGLGTQYQRFAGNGLSTHYNGNLWGVSIDFRPDSIGGTGPSASVSYDGMSMNTLLTDLNKLPMSALSSYALDARAGYSWRCGTNHWSVIAFAATSLRKGTENIFGDAASGIYPQIGELSMYRHRLTRSGIEALWMMQRRDYAVFSAHVTSAYQRSMELYISPRQKMSIERWRTAAELCATLPLKGRVIGHLSIGGNIAPILSSNFEHSATNAPNSLRELTMSQYDVLSSATSGLDVALGVTFPAGQIALRPQVRYVYNHYNGVSADSNAFEAAITLAF